MCDIIAHYMLIGGRIMYILSVILVTRCSVFTVVSPKKAHGRYTLLCAQTVGGYL